MPTTRYVLFYRPAAGSGDTAGQYFADHGAHMGAAAARGELTGFGPFGDLQTQGSMGVFTTREAAEKFVETDPFVVHGVVAEHEIREWHDMTG